MKSIGPLYVDKIQYYHRNLMPIVEKGWTQETEYPYRKSKVCLVFRFPFTKPGFVLGVWKSQKEYIFEEDADRLLSEAMGLRILDSKPEDIYEW